MKDPEWMGEGEGLQFSVCPALDSQSCLPAEVYFCFCFSCRHLCQYLCLTHGGSYSTEACGSCLCICK